MCLYSLYIYVCMYDQWCTCVHAMQKINHARLSILDLFTILVYSCEVWQTLQ